MSKSCFVISQIGADNSDERKTADCFLGLVKEVAELHDLIVARADEIVGTSDINEDIMDRVRNSDLCIIDLTGLNPNVMYEFGMRYQTGLPYIVCCSKGTALPFDTITRRTIFYEDLSLHDNCKKLMDGLRNFIRKFEGVEYKAAGSHSLNDLYEILLRINDRIENMDISVLNFQNQHKANEGIVLPNEHQFSIDVDELLGQLGPDGAFFYAYRTNHIALAEELLEYCRDQPWEYFFNKLCALTQAGSKKAEKEILELCKTSSKIESKEDRLEALGCLVSYQLRSKDFDDFENVLSFINDEIDHTYSEREKASLYNQVQRLLFAVGDYEKAEEAARQAIKFDESEPAYYYNYSLILDELGKTSEAIACVKKAIPEECTDPDHLAWGYELLSKSSEPEDKQLSQEYLKRLEIIAPFKARLAKLKIASRNVV